MTRNPNPTRIEDNNKSPRTTRNPSLIRIQDVARNPNAIRIQDVIRNPFQQGLKTPLSYNGSLIIWACVKKMKEALNMLIPAIWT